MEFIQDRITTLHGLTDSVPDAPVGQTSIIIPMTGRELRSPVSTHILREIVRMEPRNVVIPIRTDEGIIGRFHEWFTEFDVPIIPIWCNAPQISALLSEYEISTRSGKGRDVWLALGVATAQSDAEFIVIHDSDARSYSGTLVQKLCWPLANGFDFSKGYYARVERGKFYGRLFRLFVQPLLQSLCRNHDSEILEYLNSFRYSLSGEMGFTRGSALQIRAQPRWGLEIGILGDMYAGFGFGGTAQVDLGVHRHDHRAVTGSGGLAHMSDWVGAAIFQVLDEFDVSPDFERLRGEYRESAMEMIGQYERDAAFNGLGYDYGGEQEQVAQYIESIRPPRSDYRLPAWREISLDPENICAASDAEMTKCQPI